jgi:ribosome maturation factor RimP
MALGRVEELAAEVAEAHGLAVYDVHLGAYRRTQVLRVTIVRPGEQGGASVGDCARVSRELSQMLDAEDPFGHAYTLEVSTPGVERELTRPEHFAWAVGERVYVVASEGADGSCEIEGVLESFDSERRVMMVASQKRCVEIELGTVRTARTKFVFQEGR